MLPSSVQFVMVTAVDKKGDMEQSIAYRVLSGHYRSESAAWLYCRGMLDEPDITDPMVPISYEELADILLPLCDPSIPVAPAVSCTYAVSAALANNFSHRRQRLFTKHTILPGRKWQRLPCRLVV